MHMHNEHKRVFTLRYWLNTYQHGGELLRYCVHFSRVIVEVTREK